MLNSIGFIVNCSHKAFHCIRLNSRLSQKVSVSIRELRYCVLAFPPRIPKL